MSHSNSEEFARLVEASGWNYSEVARRIDKTPGAISRICSGEFEAADSTLKLFKLILAQEKPEALGSRTLQDPDPKEETETNQDQYEARLATLPDPQRRLFESVREDHRRTEEKLLTDLEANSRVASAARASGASALRAARELGQGSRPSPPIGGSTSYKRRPRRGTGSRSKGQQSPPTQAPE